MSFEDLEAGTRPRAPLPLSEVAEYAVSQIKTKVGALRHHGDMLGTPRDTPALRSRIRVTRAEALRLAKITSQKLSQAAAAAADSADATQRIAPDAMSKLAKNFEATLRDFQQVLHRIVAAERQIIISASAADAANAGTSAEQLQKPLLATGREDHEAFVSERELGVLEAEHGIAQIDDMLRNLATLLVGDQGGSTVDHVVCDIERIAQQTTSQAADEKISGMVKAPVATGMVKTPVATRSSGRCLLMFVLALFLLILFLVIVGR